MSFGTMVDVAIGLAMTYLLISLMVTTLQETLATAMATRGKTLLAGLTALLEPNETTSSSLSQLTQAVLGHPLVKATDAKRPPSYLDSAHFALALVDSLADGSPTPLSTQVERGVANLPDGSTKTALTVFVQHAEGNLGALKSQMETWFDAHMDRVSGAYRRHAQTWAFGIGLALAVVLNVDSFQIASVLYNGSDVRQTAVAMANIRLTADAAQPTDTFKSLMDSAVKLPIGWDCPGTARVCDNHYKQTDLTGKVTYTDALVWEKLGTTFYPTTWRYAWNLVMTLLGWIASAVAVSLGAPFWFDTLQRLFSMRGAGPQPKSSTATK